MADHLWTILCTKALIDETTHNVSLIEIVEQLQVAGATPGELHLAAVPMELVSMWRRSDPAERGSFPVRIRFLPPSGVGDGPFLPQSYVVNFEKHSQVRQIFRMPGVVVTEAGVHVFVVERGEGADWTEVARVPLLVQYTPAVPSAG